MPKLFDVAGRNVVITGAAGFIGRAVCKGFAEAGAKVAMVDLRKAELEEVAAEVAALGPDPVTVVGDVSVPEGSDAIVEATVAALGQVDVLFSNVGHGIHVLPEQLSDEDFEWALRVNLYSAFHMTRGFGRHMIKRGIPGSIVCTSSICGSSAMGRGNFAYSIAKAGVEQLTKELALEWGHFGIRVNAIAPCQVETARVAALMAGESPGGEKLGDRFINGIPLARLATPEDMVGPVLFLASDAAAMVSGSVLAVDGGNLAMNAVASVRAPAVDH